MNYLDVPEYGSQNRDSGKERLYYQTRPLPALSDLDALVAKKKEEMYNANDRTYDKGEYVYDPATGKYTFVPRASAVAVGLPASPSYILPSGRGGDGPGYGPGPQGDGYSPMSSPLSQSFNGSLGYNLAQGYSTALGGLLPGAVIAGMIAQGMSPGQIAEAGKLSAQAQQDAVAGYVSGTMFGAPPSSASTFGGAGYGTPVSEGGYGVTSQTGGGTAANPMSVDPATAQGQQAAAAAAAAGTTGQSISDMAESEGVALGPAATSNSNPELGYARGGIAALAQGGLGSLGDYSDGGQLLRGPGDGVSDSIPASIANKRPARLADGEFVVPSRIVSELGNGSTEAGARKLYAMLDRIQAGRKKSIGKGKVAVNSKAQKQLPA